LFSSLSRKLKSAPKDPEAGIAGLRTLLSMEISIQKPESSRETAEATPLRTIAR